MNALKSMLVGILATGALLTAQADTQTAQPPTQVVTQPQTQPAQQAGVITDKVNINTATADELKRVLVGIGQKKAEAIVQYREKHGAFTAAEQLLEVQGFGKATLEKNRDRILF